MQRTGNPCQASTGDSLTSTSNDPGPPQVVYTLEAHSPWTMAVATQTVTLTRTFVGMIGQLTIANQSGRDLVMWVLGYHIGINPYDDGRMLGGLADGQATSYLPLGLRCIPVMIVAVDPTLVTAHNQQFGDNLQPTDLTTAQNSRFWRWNTQTFRFHESAVAVGTTIL